MAPHTGSGVGLDGGVPAPAVAPSAMRPRKRQRDRLVNAACDSARELVAAVAGIEQDGAWHDGTVKSRTRKPRPLARNTACTPPGASSPKAGPPDSNRASTGATLMLGFSDAVSRSPGAPPNTATEAVAGASKITMLTPETSRAAPAWPTCSPATSVMALRVVIR